MNFRCKRASVRAAALCLAALLALSLLAGCAKPNPQSVLYRRGMSVVYTMCDMASSDYLRLLYGERAADMLDKTQEDGTTLRGQMDAALDGEIIRRIARYRAEYGKTVCRVDAPALEVSSTEIRQAVAAGRSIDDMVPPAVAAYIREKNLYREGDGTHGNDRGE